jgi:hypothetical protein
LKAILTLLAALALPGLILVAALLWSRPRASRLFLLLAVGIGYLLPLFLALLPLKWMIKEAPTMGRGGFGGPRGGGGMGMGGGMEGPDMASVMLMAVMTLLPLFPLILAFWPALVRGAVRVKSLLPEAVLPGWLAIAAFPLHVLVLCFVFQSLNQGETPALQYLTLVFFLLPPLAFLILPGQYLRPAPGGLNRVFLTAIEWVVFGCHCLGALLVFIYWTTKEGPPFLYLAVLYFQYLGALLAFSATAADFSLGASVSAWRDQRALAKTGDAATFDQRMSEAAEVVQSKRKRRRYAESDE